MSLEKNDFYGKDVAEAIKKACDKLAAAQENLDIEVIETGSTGIFGLIRKKAHIRVAVKPDVEEENLFEMGALLSSNTPDESPEEIEEEPVLVPSNVIETPQDDEDEDDELSSVADQDGEASPESLKIVEEEVARLTELMGFPSTLETHASGLSVTCIIRGEHEDSLAGQDGKVLDSLQYIVRKIVSRKVAERLRISINVGEFREKRLEELKVRAAELAAMVKADGKTQVLPGLNPSERRIIHMIFQEDKEIRSRSVGDGLFKKILIYKPGKGNRPNGRKRSPSKGRQGKGGNKQNKDS